MILSVCNVPEVLKIIRIVKLVITLIKVIVPIILIITGMIDYTKATGDGESLSKTNQLFVKKIIAAVIIFFIPTFVNIIFNIVDPNNKTYISCLNQATSERIEALYEKNMMQRIEAVKTDKSRADYQEAKLYLSNIKDPAKRKEYEQALEEMKEYVELPDINASGEGLTKEQFEQKLATMDTPTLEQLKLAVKANNLPENYEIKLVGTAHNEGYLEDPYLYYGWASALINHVYTDQEMLDWDPNGNTCLLVPGINYYAKECYQEGFNKASANCKKAVYLALTERNTKIVECNGTYTTTPSEYNLLYKSSIYNCSIFERK